MGKIKVLLVAPGELPLELEIKNTLKEKQALVGGNIEVAYLQEVDDVCLICNEEGKLNGSKPNRLIGNDIIYGNFLVVGDDYEKADFKSLTDHQIKKYQEYFNEASIKRINDRFIARQLVYQLMKRRLYGTGRR